MTEYKRLQPKPPRWKLGFYTNLKLSLSKSDWSLFVTGVSDNPANEDQVQKFEKLRLKHRHISYNYVPWSQVQLNKLILQFSNFKTVLIFKKQDLKQKLEDPTFEEVDIYIIRNTSDSKILLKQIAEFPQAHHPAKKPSPQQSEQTVTHDPSSKYYIELQRPPPLLPHKEQFLTSQASQSCTSASGTSSLSCEPLDLSLPSLQSKQKQHKRKSTSPMRASQTQRSHFSGLLAQPSSPKRHTGPHLQILESSTQSGRSHASFQSFGGVIPHTYTSQTAPYMIPPRTHTVTSTMTSNIPIVTSQRPVMPSPHIPQQHLTQYFPMFLPYYRPRR